MSEGTAQSARGDDRPAPFADAYWLDGVAVAAGEYPGALRDEHALEKVRALLDAGVRRFVDLTDDGELRPYLPLLEAEAAARGVRVTHRRLSIPDMGIPTGQRMAQILDALDDAHAAGETAYVHCWGGVGRTGTVVACWLVRRGRSPDEALADVARLFATTSPAKRARHPEGSPQTSAQRAFVHRWATVERERGR